MTNTEQENATSTGRDWIYARLVGALIDGERASAELDAHRTDVLNEAIEAARGEYLEDATGTPEDEAYNQAVSDVVAAIGALLEGK